MRVRWAFYRFDHARYAELRSRLRGATSYEDFQALSDNKETRSILDELQNQEIHVEEVRAAFIQILCCLGEPLSVDRSFARSISLLARDEDTEEGRELLSALLSGGKNMEAWMLPSATLSGFLTPEEAVVLYAACVPQAKPRQRSGQRPKRRRRPVGGLVGACMRFFRLLLDRGPLIEEMVELLLKLLETAVRRGEGLAVVLL